MLRDASASLDINAVADPRLASDFTPLSGDLALGYSSDAVWLRFAVQRAVGAPDEWWLSMEPGFLNNLTLYLPQPEGGFITQHSGTHIPLKERPIALPEAVFPVNFTQLMPEDTASVVMYLRLESNSTLALKAQWQTIEQYTQSRLFNDLRTGILLGFLGLASLISLLAGIWLQQRFFYITTVYLLFFGLMQIHLNGYGQYLLGLWWPAAQATVAQVIIGLLTSGLSALYAGFVFGYLQPAAYWPRFTRCLWGVSYSNILVLAAIFAGVPWRVIAPYFFTVSSIAAAALVVLFVLMLPHRRRPAQLMLMMFVPGLAAAGLQTLRNLGWIPLNFWTSSLWEYTLVFQVPFAAVVVLLRMRDEEQAMAQARQREQAQRSFIDIMAHELRTPLAIVQTALGNLEARTAQDRPDLTPRFERIARALKRLNTMVDNALVQRHLERGGAFKIRPTAPSALIDQVWAMVVTDDHHPIKMAAIDDNSPVPMDADWMALALLNLIENAIKYSPEGGIVAVRCLRSPTHWTLEVTDQGIGLAAQTEASLFERFYRSDQARQVPNVTGMGLGLYLVQQVALAHKGSAQGCNHPEGGSIFTLTLPTI